MSELQTFGFLIAICIGFLVFIAASIVVSMLAIRLLLFILDVYFYYKDRRAGNRRKETYLKLYGSQAQGRVTRPGNAPIEVTTLTGKRYVSDEDGPAGKMTDWQVGTDPLR